MKVGDKIRFVKHEGRNQECNEELGLFICGIYEVQGIDERDGSPFVKTDKFDYCPTYLTEIEKL